MAKFMNYKKFAMVAFATIAFTAFGNAAKKAPVISGQVTCDGKPVSGV